MADRLTRFAYAIMVPIERRIARYKRRRYCGCVVAITGSCGKSTTTYLTGELLKTSARMRSAPFHNDIRTALREARKLNEPVDFLVQEVSGAKPGAIAHFMQTMSADIAVVTAVGLDHYTVFRSMESVAAEKGTLVEMLPITGVACLNADDALVRAMAERAPGRIVLFGTSADAEVRAENIDAAWPRRLGFDLVAGEGRWRVETQFAGTVMLTNILGALAVVHAAGKDMAAAIAQLRELPPLPTRMSIVSGTDRHDYVLDTFKASLWSARRVLDDLPVWGSARRIVVLGDISDKGNDGGRKLKKLLRQAAMNADYVIGMGESAGPAERLSKEPGSRVVAARSVEEARALLRAQPPSVVLLKSNRTVPLATLVPAPDVALPA